MELIDLFDTIARFMDYGLIFSGVYDHWATSYVVRGAVTSAGEVVSEKVPIHEPHRQSQLHNIPILSSPLELRTAVTVWCEPWIKMRVQTFKH